MEFCRPLCLQQSSVDLSVYNRVLSTVNRFCQQGPVDESVETEFCRIPTDFDRFTQQGPVDHSQQQANQVVKQINSTHLEENSLKAEIQTLMKKSNRFGFTGTDFANRVLSTSLEFLVINRFGKVPQQSSVEESVASNVGKLYSSKCQLEKTIRIVRVVGELVETNGLVEPENRFVFSESGRGLPLLRDFLFHV
ncbi:hypothetical protein ACLOJK_003984 [Asimina triloba]